MKNNFKLMFFGDTASCYLTECGLSAMRQNNDKRVFNCYLRIAEPRPFRERVYCTLRNNATVQLNTTIFLSTFAYSLGLPCPLPLTTKGFPFTAPSIRSAIFMDFLTTFCGVKVRLIRDQLPVHLTKSRKVK